VKRGLRTVAGVLYGRRIILAEDLDMIRPEGIAADGEVTSSEWLSRGIRFNELISVELVIPFIKYVTDYNDDVS
jgi:hypothetical protein